jgi:hypothetical protein
MAWLRRQPIRSIFANRLSHRPVQVAVTISFRFGLLFRRRFLSRQLACYYPVLRATLHTSVSLRPVRQLSTAPHSNLSVVRILIPVFTLVSCTLSLPNGVGTRPCSPIAALYYWGSVVNYFNLPQLNVCLIVCWQLFCTEARLRR